jgi:hypothetical protein
VASKFTAETYKCSICLQTTDFARTQHTNLKFFDACSSFFSTDICSHNIFSNINIPGDEATLESRSFCRSASLCSAPEELPFLTPNAQSKFVDFKISKAIGSKGYDKIRISVVSNETIDSPLFSYSAPFKYRWTNNVLSTGIFSIVPGEKTKISIAGNDISVYIPKQNEGSRGLIIADPCFQNEWIVCEYGKSLQFFNRTIKLLNAMNAFDDIHYFQILGDNFYDQQGYATASWFQSLSDQSKSKIFATVPGSKYLCSSWSLLSYDIFLLAS